MIVRGTQSNKPKEIEVNVDTVYIRRNIQRIEEENFMGWEYEEEQMSIREYIEKIIQDKQLLEQALVELTVLIGGASNV